MLRSLIRREEDGELRNHIVDNHEDGTIESAVLKLRPEAFYAMKDDFKEALENAVSGIWMMDEGYKRKDKVVDLMDRPLPVVPARSHQHRKLIVGDLTRRFPSLLRRCPLCSDYYRKRTKKDSTWTSNLEQHLVTMHLGIKGFWSKNYDGPMKYRGRVYEAKRDLAIDALTHLVQISGLEPENA